MLNLVVLCIFFSLPILAASQTGESPYERTEAASIKFIDDQSHSLSDKVKEALQVALGNNKKIKLAFYVRARIDASEDGLLLCVVAPDADHHRVITEVQRAYRIAGPPGGEFSVAFITTEMLTRVRRVARPMYDAKEK